MYFEGRKCLSLRKDSEESGCELRVSIIDDAWTHQESNLAGLITHHSCPNSGPAVGALFSVTQEQTMRSSPSVCVTTIDRPRFLNSCCRARAQDFPREDFEHADE